MKLNDEQKVAFEQWYVENAFDPRQPIGSRDCGLQREAYAAGIAYAQKWRSMESEKPARWQFCIVAVDGIVPQAVLEWDGAQFLIGLSDSKYPFPVTHWMPLPLPPTEVK